MLPLTTISPPAASSDASRYYVPLPRRLTEDLRDSPTAIGAYALVSRIFRVTQAPVPLSPGDLQAVDPSLSYGAATRALQRLAASAYVAVTKSRGRKSIYTPTWGTVRGAPLPWDLAAPCLGRPRHVVALRLEQRLLDTCLGRVRPHAEHPAIVERYFSKPLLSLEDIGAYALALAGLAPASGPLRRLGLLDITGRPLPLPDDMTILAIVSQRAIGGAADSIELTPAGWARSAFAAPAPAPTPGGQALFFVSEDQIGGLIAPMIAPMIAHPISDSEPGTGASTASGRHISAPAQPAKGSHGLMDSHGEKRSTTRAETSERAGGGITDQTRPPTDPAPAAQQQLKDESGQEPESTRLLLAIGVRRSVARQLAAQPSARVAGVIAEARARGDVRDLAAWVVSALRDLPVSIEGAAPVQKVSDKAILLYPDLSPRERQLWLHRFRTADPTERPAVLARFHQEVAHAALP